MFYIYFLVRGFLGFGGTRNDTSMYDSRSLARATKESKAVTQTNSKREREREKAGEMSYPRLQYYYVQKQFHIVLNVYSFEI